MKNILFFYRLCTILKPIVILIISILNIYGLYLMTKVMGNWKFYIELSIYMLVVVLILSMIIGYSRKKIVNTTLSIFLKENNIEEYKTIKQTEDLILIEKDNELYTIEIKFTKNGVGYIITPAEITWQGKIITWDKSVENIELKFKPHWEQPKWDRKDEKTDL